VTVTFRKFLLSFERKIMTKTADLNGICLNFDKKPAVKKFFPSTHGEFACFNNLKKVK